MAMRTNLWAIVSVVFLVWAVAATSMAASYFQTTQNQQKIIDSMQDLIDEVTIKASIAIDYGNGTTVWHNDTVFPVGTNLFNATKKIANLTFDTTFDIYVTGINGVMQNATSGQFWVYEIWNNGTWEIDWSTTVTTFVVGNHQLIRWSLHTWT